VANLKVRDLIKILEKVNPEAIVELEAFGPYESCLSDMTEDNILITEDNENILIQTWT